MSNMKFIHLLYVPTMACNMNCKYCYLEDNTKDEMKQYKAIDTLKYAINKFKNNNVMPFNISLHGGEVTTLSKEDFHDIIEYISNYYNENKNLIEENGFRVGTPHIKTNLYNLEKHIDTIKEFNVSISGSLDLPFSLHDEYRITKGNNKTLDKILKNIELLNKLENKKKVSATIFKEHYNRIDEIIENIEYLNKNTCLDMNDFNFMIGFDYNSNGLLTPLTEEEQVDFFNKMHEHFDNTDLDSGVNGAWFNEFGPDYCTNCDNCGEKFFLLEKNGDIYSCVRGQKHKEFYYGNIYNNTIEEILNNAYEKIMKAHNMQKMSEECKNCDYLYICKTGCPFVKNIYNSNKSYTCKLQKELYKKRNYEPINDKSIMYDYMCKMHPDIADEFIVKNNNEHKNLEDLIKEDIHLKYIYDPNSFILSIDGNEYNLESQILKKSREIVYITNKSKVVLYIRKNIINEECEYPENNSVWIMLLSGDTVQYGDEKRVKQRHIMTHQIYKGVLDQIKCNKDDFYCYDITSLLKEYSIYLSNTNPNNIFFTTASLRDYHYLKQKNNAYYHIEAINLPFQNIEFNYLEWK